MLGAGEASYGRSSRKGQWINIRLLCRFKSSPSLVSVSRDLRVIPPFRYREGDNLTYEVFFFLITVNISYKRITSTQFSELL